MIGTILLREFQKPDINILQIIDSHCFPPAIAFSRGELLFYILHPASYTPVAVLNGQIVGFAIGRVEACRTGHIITLDVMEGERRHGIGTLLMNALHEEFRKRRLKTVVLEVSASNAAARQFYAGMHYDHRETIKGYYPDGSDAFRLVHTL